MKYTLLFFLLIAASCNNSTFKSSFELKKEPEQLDIYISPSIDPVTNNLAYFEQDTDKYLVYAHMNTLYFFDIKKNKLFHKTVFQQKGPDGIGKLTGYHIENFDSIYVFSAFSFCLTDSSAQVKKRFQLLHMKNNTLPVLINTPFYRFNNRIVRINNSLYIPTYLVDESDDATKFALGIEYNILKDTVLLTDKYYPPIDDRNQWNSREYGEEKWVYSFMSENDLYKIEANGQYEKIPCKSKYAPSRLIESPPSMDLKESVISSIRDAKYMSIVYDPWKNLFYRFYYPGVDLDNDPNKEISYYWALKDNDKLFSIMILNNDLEVIGETLMPEDSYNPAMFFVNEDGLYFALHVNNPDFDPDYLKFARFTVEPVME